MLQMAAGISIKIHKRADEYCDGKSQLFGAVVAHICKNVEGDDIIWATCTFPLVKLAEYKKTVGCGK